MDGLAAGKAGHERPEVREGGHQVVLVEEADGRRDLRLGITGRAARRPLVEPLGGLLMTRELEPRALLEQPIPRPLGLEHGIGAAAGRGEVVRVEEFVGALLPDRVAAEPLCQLEGADPIARVAGPEERDPAVVLDDRTLRVDEPEPLHRIDTSLRPGAEGLFDLRPPGNDETDRHRGLPGIGLGLREVGAGREGEPDDRAGRDERGERGNSVDTSAGRHRHIHGSGNPRTATIVFEGMAGYRELLQQVNARIVEVDGREAQAMAGAAWIDVREQDEWDEGHIPGAIHVPRGYLESRIEAAVADHSRPVVLYCASGIRSAFAADTLAALGYERPVSLAGGFSDWKRNGFPVDLPKRLSPERRARYSRHLLIPEIGEEGQLKLLESRILLIGAGGLGSPASLYLAAAGVGHIGIIDADIVDESNLQRQIAHSLNTLGTPKVDSARRAIEALNPDVEVTTYRERLTSENIDRILADGWQIILDGADNFPTRYLVNDASVWKNIPVVHGSIFRFDGQVTVFKPGAGPCYRCLYASPPPPELAPSCSEGGVLGVLPGIVGTLQTNEALKLAIGMGDPLIGRLLLFDALATDFQEVQIRRNPDCPVCGEEPTIHEYIDYVEFCSGTVGRR